MELSKLPNTNTKARKRVGRGYGSGRGGHTSGRGHKGQKARGSIGLFFQGTKFKKSLIKRLPLVRGKGKLSPKTGSVIIDLEALRAFKANELVSFETLQEKGILSKKLPKNTPVKILGNSPLEVSLNVALPVSKKAEEKIQKAGGRVIEPGSGVAVKKEVKKEKENKGKEKKETKEKNG
ncbi:50S ribosomal protein L15 [Candidatus Microgenomates bacterium]|jgi:large subunit ribosomal protein L15|nr:MAG: 50S ribosomal protein L15 [Candidatus Microgenomates bacterium]